VELAHGGDPASDEAEIRRAIEHVTAEVCAILRQMPARPAGKSRLDQIFFTLDAGLRAKTFPQEP